MRSEDQVRGVVAEIADVPANRFEEDDALAAKAKAVGQRMRDVVLLALWGQGVASEAW